MKDHFIIVAGHLDTKDKEKVALDFFDELSKLKNVKLCYCTHFENIPKKIYNIFDYVVYDKNNPILNWDLKNKVTEKFFLKTDAISRSENYTINFHIPYHGYAHFSSMCSGMSVGASQGFSDFTFMNYDVNHELLKQLPDNIQKIRECDVDGIHYEYYDENTIRKSLNTEFFTFNLKYAQTFINYLNFNKYCSFGNIVLEVLFSHISLKHNLRIAMHSKKLKDNTLGKIQFGKGVNYASKLKYFVPYETIFYRDNSYNFILLPFKKDENYKFVCIPQFDIEFFKEKDKIKLEIDNKNERICEINDIRKNSNLKFSFDDEIIREYKFDNEKHFGFIT